MEKTPQISENVSFSSEPGDSLNPKSVSDEHSKPMYASSYRRSSAGSGVSRTIRASFPPSGKLQFSYREILTGLEKEYRKYHTRPSYIRVPNQLSIEDSMILDTRYEDLVIPERQMSFSMVVDNPRRKVRGYSSIQSRNREAWVDDNAVVQCHHCDKEFGILPWKRRSHCRACGGIFCGQCVKRKAIIPEYITVPEPPSGKQFEIGKSRVRVCEFCFEKIEQLRKLEILILVFDKVSDKHMLNVDDFRTISKVCKSWNYLANFFLSKFRELQYRLSPQPFSHSEQRWLWINRKFFVGHSIWMVQLIRSVYQKNVVGKRIETEILMLLKSHADIYKKKAQRNKTCHELMCTRDCSTKFSISDIIGLLHKNIDCINIRKYAIRMLRKVSEEEFQCFIPYLCYSIKFDRVTLPDGIIAPHLIKKCARNATIANKIYFQFQILMENPDEYAQCVYEHWIEEWHQKVPLKIQQQVSGISQVQKTLRTCYEKSKKPLRTLSVHDMKENLTKDITHILEDVGHVVPTNISAKDYNLNVKKISVKSSITRPVVLEYEHQIRSDKLERNLYKKEDLRKDDIVMCIIRLIRIILKQKENLDLNIETYNILPTSSEDGFLEMVQNCQTLYTIKERKKFTLLNYLIEQNPNGNIIELRKNFLKSCAAYCVISYLLGIGDRHLENIMMTDQGVLFHIDYGFILGQDPKPMKIPAMRISSDMVDALGGPQSRDFFIFKELCDRIYNCLRRHIHHFMPLLLLLADLDPPITDNGQFTREQIVAEIIKRFAPGESYQEAKLQLNNRIENSTKTLSYAFIDFFHYHNAENTLGNFMSNTFNNGKSWLSSLFFNQNTEI